MSQKLTVNLKPRYWWITQKENQDLQRRIFGTFDVWSKQRLVDEIYFSLINVRTPMCLINSNQYDSGIIKRIYQEQARYKMYRMAIYNPPPVFVIHLKHIDERVKVQLAKEDEETRNEILKQVAERIFETVDTRFFLLSGLPFLKVRC
jgi:hypothetical protein